MKFRFKAAHGPSEELELNNKAEEKTGPKAVQHGPRLLSLQVFLTVCLTLTLVGGSFAWFSNNRQVADGATMLQSDEIKFAMTEYNVYKKPIEIEDGVINTVNDEVVALPALDLGANLIELNPYDSVFERNEYTPVYIKIKMSGANLKRSGSKLFIYLKADGLVSDGQYYYPGNTSIDTNMSNIVSVKWANGAVGGDFFIDSESETTEEIYAKLNDPDSGLGWSSAYTYLVPSGFGRDTTVVSGTSINQPALGTGASIKTDNGTYKQLCIEVGDGFDVIGDEAMLLLRIDYDSSLVQAYLNSRKQSNAARLGSTEVIDFIGDMSLVRVDCSVPD